MALQIRCTRKLLDELGLSEAMVAGIRPADTLLGNWYANILRIEREKCVLVSECARVRPFFAAIKPYINRIAETRHYIITSVISSMRK